MKRKVPGLLIISLWFIPFLIFANPVEELFCPNPAKQLQMGHFRIEGHIATATLKDEKHHMKWLATIDGGKWYLYASLIEEILLYNMSQKRCNDQANGCCCLLKTPYLGMTFRICGSVY